MTPVLWGSLISSGRCPFRTSFFCIIFLLILFWSDERTPNDNSAPGVVLASSSSVELDESDSDNLVTFIFASLECIGIFLGAAFTWDAKLSFNETWPYMYGRIVVIKLLDDSITNLKDSGPHESFINKSSDTTSCELCSSNRLEELGFGSRGRHSPISIYKCNWRVGPWLTALDLCYEKLRGPPFYLSRQNAWPTLFSDVSIDQGFPTMSNHYLLPTHFVWWLPNKVIINY